MREEQINALLDKYFAGESTLAEEQALKAFFQQPDVPEQWVRFKPWFVFVEQAKTQQTSANFDQRWQQPPQKVVALRSRRQWYAVATAAVVVLAVSVWWFRNAGANTATTQELAAIDWQKYEPASDEEALELAKAALRKSAKALKTGVNSAQREVHNLGQLALPGAH